MSIRQHPTKGPGWWHIDIYRDGKRQIIPFNGTKQQAVETEHQLRRQFKQDCVPTLHPKISEVIPDFISEYRIDHQPLGVARTMQSFSFLLPVFGPYRFTSLTPSLIEQYKSRRINDGVSPSTINKELCALSTLIKWAIERGYCTQLPFTIKKFPRKLTKAPLPVVPTREEVLAILHAADPTMRGLYCALYYGGLRDSEALHLRAEDCYMERNLMIIRGKGNKQRPVPVLPELAAVLAERIAAVGGSGYLWINPRTGKPYSELKKGLKGAAKRAGVTKNIYPHLLRHAFGTHSTEAGIGLRTLQEVLGHSSPQTTQIYTTLGAQHLIKEMQRFTTTVSENTEKEQ